MLIISPSNEIYKTFQEKLDFVLKMFFTPRIFWAFVFAMQFSKEFVIYFRTIGILTMFYNKLVHRKTWLNDGISGMAFAAKQCITQSKKLNNMLSLTYKVVVLADFLV